MTDISVIGVGLYTISEVASLLGRHVNTVRSWVHKGLAPAPVHLAFGETAILSFYDLVSLMVVRCLTDEGVNLRKVRKAELYLRTVWELPRPFASNRVFTEGVGVFIEPEPGEFIAADRWGQEGLGGVLRTVLKDVTYDAVTELAESWTPVEGVVLRPDIQFGQPCIRGTRLTTRTVAELVSAGDASTYVADAYSITLAQVEAAVDFEESLLRKAA
jgi:uncharacterized protein (DUF433 family)